MIEHKASHSTSAFDVVKHLENTLESKQNVRKGQLAEIDRLQRAIIDSNEQIVEIGAAIDKLKADT